MALAIRPGVYRHFKHGNFYKVFGIIPDAGELKAGEPPRPPLVFYQALYGEFAHCYRTYEDFTATVDRPEHNYEGPRFTFIRPI
jgi:hypothetical protein